MTLRTNTYFISDLHLGASYIAHPKVHERYLCRWLNTIAPNARTIYLLGDVLDYWYEYRTVVPRGFVRFFGTLASLADSGVKIVWLKGNHDIWIYDYLPSELGIEVVDGIVDTDIDGHRFVMEHGDGVGEMRRSYRLMRRLFRNRLAQRLFSAIHPRWTVGFAHRWSSHSRKHGCPGGLPPVGPDDPLVKWARNYMDINGRVDYFVVGHRHVQAYIKLCYQSHLAVIGECFDMMTYAVWDGEQFSIKKMQNDIGTP